MKLKVIHTLIAALALASVSLHAQAPQYNVTTHLGFFTASALNNGGQIVGYYTNQFSQERAFLLYPNGTFLDLGTLGGPDARANAINLYGEIVGSSTNKLYYSGAFPHAFLYSDGVMTDLGTLKSPYGRSDANAINNLGQIVGSSDVYSNNASSIATVFWQGKIIPLSSINSWANDINNNSTNNSTDIADIVGAVSTGSNFTYAFLYSNETMIDIGSKICPDTLPASEAQGINDAKQIIGYCCKGDASACFQSKLAFFYDSVSGYYDFIRIAGDGGTTVAYGIRACPQLKTAFESLPKVI